MNFNAEHFNPELRISYWEWFRSKSLSLHIFHYIKLIINPLSYYTYSSNVVQQALRKNFKLKDINTVAA